jgi:2-polyprenyl-3-methyl-5-hydroxy-6-metoxy-1,4-benzoquinol methylase
VTAPAYAFKADPYSSHAVILDWLGDGHGRRVLDVGAADGLLSRRLSARGWRVTAIERDPALAAVAEPHVERLVRADLDTADATHVAVDGPFDAIVYGDVLEHVGDPLAVLRRLDRALAPGGVVVLSIPNVAHLWMRLSLLGGRFQYGDRGLLDRTHLRFFTDRSLRDLLREAHLAIERWTATPVPLHQVVPAEWQGRWLDRVHAVSAAVSRRVPRLLGYQFVVLARPEPDAAGSRRQG